MKPVRTANSNLVYTGPPGVGDLHCQRMEPGWIRSVWQLSAVERELIAVGANLVVDVFVEPVQPMAIGITAEQGIGEDAPEVTDRLRQWTEQQGAER